MKRSLILPLLLPLFVASCCIGPDAPRPTMQYTTEGSGCADFIVYKSNASGTEYLRVQLNREVHAVSTQPRTFDLAATPTGLVIDIDVYPSRPQSPRYCNDALIADDPSPEVWSARSGRVTISVSADTLTPDPNNLYKATVKLEGLTFRSRDGETVFLEEEVFENVTVGWYPG
jgi:hypothetical protein